MKDYSDYYQYSWSKIKPPLPFALIFLQRLLIYAAVIGLGLYLFIPKVIHEVDAAGQIFYTAFITTLCLIVVAGLHVILNSIAKIGGPQLINFKVSRAGIAIDRRLFPFAEIDTAATLALISPLVLSKNQWSKHPIPQPLTVPSLKKIVLQFPDQESRQRTLTSLTHYLTG